MIEKPNDIIPPGTDWLLWATERLELAQARVEYLREQRNLHIAEAYATDDSLTLKKIAEMCGISAQQVRMIVHAQLAKNQNAHAAYLQKMLLQIKVERQLE